MAETGKINSIFDVPAITKEKEVVSRLIADLWKEMEKGLGGLDKSQAMFGDAKKISDVAKAIDTLNKAKADSAKQMTEVAKLQQKLVDLDTKEAKEIATLKLAIQDKNKATKENIKTQGQAKDSLTALSAEANKLTKEFNNLSKAERESAKGKELQTKIKGMNDELKEQQSQLGKNTLNVGNYGSALQGIPGPVGQVSGAISKFSKVLLANPIILIITAIVAAVGLLVKAFKATDDGGTELAARFEQLKVIMDVVIDRVGRVATGLFNILKGNFSEGVKQIGDAFDGMANQVRKGIDAAYDFTYAMDELNDRNAAFISQEAQLRNEIAKLEALAQNQTKSTKERGDALTEVQKKEEEIVEFKKTAAIEAYDLEIGKIAAKKGISEKTLRYIIEGNVKEVESARKTNKEIGDARNRLGDETTKQLEELNAARFTADTLYFKGSKRMVAKLSGFLKQANTDRIAGLAKVAAETERLEKEIYDIKVKYGLISKEEIANIEIKAFEESEAASAFSEEQRGVIRLGIRAKNNKEFIKQIQSLDLLQVGLADQTAKLLEKIDQESWEQRSARIDEETEKRKEAQQAIISQATELAYQIADLVNVQYERKLTILDEEAAADEAAKERELEAAGNNVNKRNEIEAKFAQKEKERAAENLKIRQKQAKFNKTVGIVDATINTLVGVTKAFSDPGGILGIVLAALILISGLAAVATIISTPIPTYKTGREGGKAEMAVVGEAGQEAIVTRSGGSYLTPDRASLAYLPEGSSVIPHKDLVSMYGRSSMTDVPRWAGSDGVGLMELSGKLDITNMQLLALQNVVKNKKEAHISIDKRGIQTAFKNGAVYEEWMNNKIRM